MNLYLNMIVQSFFLVLFSAVVYCIEKKFQFEKNNKLTWQIACGVIFGSLAIFFTEFGMDINGAKLDVRNAAVLTSGLLFGAPAGITSGIIAAIERYLTTVHSYGINSQIAGAAATLIIGFFGAIVRVLMFDNKKPLFYYGIVVGAVGEILDIIVFLFTNSNDPYATFEFLQTHAIYLIIINGIAVMLSVLAVSILGKNNVTPVKTLKKISQTFQRYMLLCVIITFIITSLFTFFINNEFSNYETDKLLSLNLKDVHDDIMEASDKNILSLNQIIANIIQTSDDNNLNEIAKEFEIAEINVIDNKGFIVQSTEPGIIGFDMSSGEQSGAFLVLLNNKTNEFVQSYGPRSDNQTIFRKYSGVALPDGGFVQIGYDYQQFKDDIHQQVIAATHNRHVGENGFLIICDENWNIVSDPDGHEGHNFLEALSDIDINSVPENVRFKTTVHDDLSYCMYKRTEGYIILGILPYSEAVFSRDIAVYIMVSMEALTFTALFILIYYLIKRLIVDNISEINTSLSKITNGNLNVTVDVRSNQEFASLSDDINSTVTTLKHYIKEAAARIDKELEFAKAIQFSSLPSVFPPYPNRDEFEIWAGMRAAKEVGGDFYDFYMLDDDKFAFVIADVSGKGIPAAMFMMTTKTLLKSLAETGIEIDEIITRANNKLCEGNATGMFVTAWMGILDIKTGVVTFANAGHNPPLLKKNDNEYKFIQNHPNFILAVMEGTKYQKHSLQLEPGDILYFYTDGITEANNVNDEFYGDDRLKSCLNNINDGNPEIICHSVEKNISDFVGDAPQFDDMTMLCLKWNGIKKDDNKIEKEICIDAVSSNIHMVTDFINKYLKAVFCPQSVQMQINIVIDELFSNIANYAYDGKSKPMIIKLEISKKPSYVGITFIDYGKPFNPLENKTPDINASVDERNIGGLGIFIVNEIMDDVSYEYKDDSNRLKILKRW